MKLKPKYRSILVVDDDPSHRSLLQRALGYEGYMVLTAEGGREGLELVRRVPLDLILLDVMMPDMNGIEMAKLLRTEGLGVPILFLSANDEAEICAQVAQLGAPLLVKPIPLSDLLEQIAKTLPSC